MNSNFFRRSWAALWVCLVCSCNLGYDTDSVRLAGDSGAEEDTGSDVQSDGGCFPESDIVLCDTKGAECGPLSTTDSCGQIRQIPTCGSCPGDVACDSNNVCGESACSNGRDDDADLKVDCADEDCVGRKCSGNKTCMADGTCN